MTVALWLGTSGRLDKVPTEDSHLFESEFLDYLRRLHDAILAASRLAAVRRRHRGALMKATTPSREQFETSEVGSIHAGDQVKEGPWRKRRRAGEDRQQKRG